MAQARLEHQKAWDSLSGAPRAAAPRPASSFISHQNHATAQIVYAQQKGQQMNTQLHPTPSQSLQRRPVPYRQYPSESNSRPAHTSRVSTPPAPRSAHNVPAVLSVGQPRQQQQPQQQPQAYTHQPKEQPARYRHSLHPQALMNYNQYQQNRHQQQQQKPASPPQPLQNSRNGADSGYVDWTNAASRLSTMSASTAASTAPSLSASMPSSSEHMPVPRVRVSASFDKSPLARVPVPATTATTATTKTQATPLSHRASMILPATHDARLCPEPLRIPRRPVSVGADMSKMKLKLDRPELRISTQVTAAGAAAPVVAAAAAATLKPGAPLSACTYRSADYEDYMSPVLAAERRESSSNDSHDSNESSEFDEDLNEMLRAELELKLGLMSMGPIRSHLEAGGKLSAVEVAADPMLAAEWRRWRDYLGEGVDDE